MSSLILPKTGLAGYFRAEITNSFTGIKKLDTGWIPNLITNQGLDMWGKWSYIAFDYMYAIYDPLDRTIDPSFAELEWWDDVLFVEQKPVQNTFDYVTSPTNYSEIRRRMRIQYNSTTNQFNQLGLGWIVPANATTGEAAKRMCFSRASIVDEFGVPLLLSIQPGDILDITHGLRMYPPTTDYYGSFTYAGQTYNVTMRAAGFTSGSPDWIVDDRAQFSNYSAGVFSDDIKTIYSRPASWLSIGLSPTASPYVAGSLQLTGSTYFDLDQGIGDIKSFVFGTASNGDWQMSFTPTISKTRYHTLKIDHGFQWNRY